MMAANPPSTTTALDYAHPLLVRDREISASDLVRRLKFLNLQLRSFPQDSVNLSSCTDAATHLAHSSLLKHRDRAVQILVATCIAEILRLFAPSPPYSHQQLQDIFALMASQCSRLNQTENPYHAYHLQLLDSIVLVRSIGLISDLDTVEDLILAFFTNILASVSDKLPPHVHRHAADLLIAIIEECPIVPLDALMLLLEPLVPPTITDQSFDRSADSADQSATFKLVCNVIRNAGQLLNKPIAEHLLNSSLQAAKHANDRVSESTKYLAENKSVHYLMTVLYPLNAPMLVNVIPQLEEELIADHPQFRELALRTLGAMFRVPASVAPSLVRDAAPAWRAWCSRSMDKLTPVRLAWLSVMPDIYNAHAHLEGVAGDLNAALARLLLDPDDKVRTATCALFGSSRFHFETLRKAASTEVWDALGARIRDRRSAVRLAAIQATGFLWRSAMHVILPAKFAPKESSSAMQTSACPMDVLSQAQSQLTTGSASSFQLAHTNLEPSELMLLLTTFAWCPRDLLNSAYLNDSELTAMLENLLIESVIHPKDISTKTETDWTLVTDRLLWFLSPIVDDGNEKVKRAFSAIIARQRVTVMEVGALIDSAEQYVSGIVQLTPAPTEQSVSKQEHLVQLISGMAARLPSSHQSEQILNMFVKTYSPAWGPKLLALGEWHEHSLVEMRKAVKTVVRAIEGAIPGSINTFGIIARRMTPLIVCREMVMPLVDRVLRRPNKNNDALSQFVLEAGYEPRLRTAAHWVLDLLAREVPLVVSRYANEIVPLLGPAVDRSFLLRVLSLVPCTNLSSASVSTLVQWGKSSTENVAYIASVVARGNYQPECAQLVQYCTDVLSSESSEMAHVASALQILNKIAKYQVQLYQDSDKEDGLTTIAMQWLFRDYTEERDGAFSESWVEAHQLPSNTKAQVAAIKLVTNRCIGLSESLSKDVIASEAVDPLMALLDRILTTNGSLGMLHVPAYASSIVRMTAGRAVLKIACTRTIADMIPESVYLRMSVLIGDSVEEVRGAILAKVRYLLANTKVSARWVPLLAMAANDPSTRASTSTLLRGMASHSLRSRGVEQSLSRLVHVVAHLIPTGRLASDGIKPYVAPIDMFLDAVMRAENVAVLFNQLVQIKEHQCRDPILVDRSVAEGEEVVVDGLSQSINAHLYTLAEYGTKQVKDKCKFHGWPITTVTQAVTLPKDIYMALDSSAAVANAKIVYLDNAGTKSSLSHRRRPPAAAARKFRDMESGQDSAIVGSVASKRAKTSRGAVGSRNYFEGERSDKGSEEE